MTTPDWPAPGSPDELAAFSTLQENVAELYHLLARDSRQTQTVVIVPSLSMDPRELQKISGVYHYEERMLVNLMLLRQPRTRVVYVTSQKLDPVVVDYYLSLLPGIPYGHARARLEMLDCNDRSNVPLSQKIIDRPRLIKRIQREIIPGCPAHMVCFNSTNLERTLALRLGLPLNSTDPQLAWLGTKSGCRETFREAGVLMPDGFEDLANEKDIIASLAELKRRNPQLRRAVVKYNEGFSGEGNATFQFEGCPETGLEAWVSEHLPKMEFGAHDLDWDIYREKFAEMGGIVEAFVDGRNKRSPSAQYRIDPAGHVEAISTHDQVLGGLTDQEFLGALFPADEAYRLEVQAEGMKAAKALAEKGVLGRFAVDFISVPEEAGWKHYAIEINLRKGGTTHPFIMLQYLTDGIYDSATGQFNTPQGEQRCYYATDNLASDCYRGLLPEDLIDIAVRNGSPDRGDLIGRRLPDAVGHAYAHRDYLARFDPPLTVDRLAEADFLGFDDTARMVEGLQAMGVPVTTDCFTVLTDDHLVQWSLARQGLGICLVMAAVGDADPEMVRVPGVPAIPIPMWLVTHRELHTSRRIRLVFDALAEHLAP